MRSWSWHLPKLAPPGSVLREHNRSPQDASSVFDSPSRSISVADYVNPVRSRTHLCWRRKRPSPPSYRTLIWAERLREARDSIEVVLQA